MPLFAHIFAIAATLLMAGGVVLYDRAERQNLQSRERSEMVQELSAIRAALEGSVNSTLYLAQGMIAYVSANPGLSEAEFTAMARELMRQRSHIRNITLVRGERIAFVYPMEANRAVLGLNIFAHPVQGFSAKEALRSGNTVVGGPYDLVQGGRAFVSRTPIYVRKGGKSEYWGMASIPIDHDGIIADSGLLSSRQLKIALRGQDGSGERGDAFLGDGAIFDRPDAVKMTVTLPGGSWQLGAVMRVPSVQDVWWRYAAGLGAAGVFGVLIWALLWAFYRQKTLGAEVQNREEAWRTLTENLRETVFWTDGGCRLVYLSPSEDRLAWPERVGESWTALFSAREAAQVKAFAQAVIDGKSDSSKACFRADRGRYIQVHAGRMALPGGGYGLLGTLNDITAQIEAENQLSESRRDLAETHRIARLGGWQFDLAAQTLTLSAEYRRLHDEEDPQGPLTLPLEVFFRDFVHPQDAAVIRAAIDKAAADTENPDYHDTLEYRIVTAKGRVLNAWVHVRKKQGDPTVCVGVTQDITPLKEAQMALKASEARYRGFLEQLSDGVVVTQNGIIRYANEAMARLIGCAKSGLIGSQLTHYVSDEDKTRLMEFHRRRMNGLPSPNEYEVTMVRIDGTVRAVRNNAAMTEWDGQPAAIATVTDISERKAYENLLLLQKKQHEELLVQQSKMAAMGEMIAAIIHQFKQPMSAISLILQELPEEAAEGALTPDRLEVLTRQAMEQVEFMSKTADDFGNFFRPEKERSRFDPAQAVREVEKLLSRQLSAASIRVVYAPELFSCEVRGVCNEFKQVALNLMTNAKDAILSARRSGKLPAQETGVITVETRAQGAGMVMTVTDNGGGIPEAIIGRIFDPYFTTKEQGGTGVGLYMSKTIIESGFGGTITVENAPQGACFKITLPCA